MNIKERPRVLEALCILSFIGSGGGMLLYLAAAVFYQKTEEIVIKLSSMHTTEQIPPVYFLLLSVFFGISLTGAILMWKLKKPGFFVYLAAQAAILLLPLIWIGSEAFSAAAIIFTLVFAVGYASQYRHLGPRVTEV